MKPLGILVAAADLIRDLAAKASPGPWESAREFSQSNVVYAKDRLVDSVGVAGRRLDLNDRIFTGQTASRSRSEYEADARWIAALSPALAGDLSALLVALDGREFDAARVIAQRLSARVLGEETHG